MGKAIIFSAPSGSGKTTIAKYLLNKHTEKLGFSISACTRDKRGRSEQHGKDYYFLSIQEFKDHIDKGDFLEWEEVYPGGYYGTLKSEVQRLWDLGKAVVFDVDVKGGVNLKSYFGDDALSIYVKIPSMEELERRLRERGTDSEESISKRLYKANFEMTFQNRFDIVLVNNVLEESLEEAERLVMDFIKA